MRIRIRNFIGCVLHTKYNITRHSRLPTMAAKITRTCCHVSSELKRFMWKSTCEPDIQDWPEVVLRSVIPKATNLSNPPTPIYLSTPTQTE